MALTSARADPPDLMLLDIKMPDLNGYEVCRQLKADEATKEIPVLFISAAQEPADVVESFSAGGVDYITKPIQAEEVVASVETHLELSRMRADLETQVEVRTAELERGNELLRGEISRRRRVEGELEELITKLEVQNAELERFTYTVSHDLKAPLITIKGYLGVLSENLAEGDAESVKHDLARISKAADTMSHLLADLLELSRIGRLVGPPEDVPLGELVRDALELLDQRVEDRGVHLEILPDLPHVHGDRPRLREVLVNLIDNALKYMGDQPHPRIEIGGRNDEDETTCYVRDNGIGIEPRFQEKVFGLFDQLDPKMEGTGVGLALAKRIVEVHGGRIWIESEGAGRGSTFCFTIPSHSASEQSRGASTAADDCSGKKEA